MKGFSAKVSNRPINPENENQEQTQNFQMKLIS